MRQYMITVFVIAVTALAGFLMPSALLEWQDEQRLEASEVQAAEEVVLTSQAELTVIEKLQLMQSDTVTKLPMAQGKNYDRDSIIIKVQQEIKKLCELEILSIDSLERRYLVEGVEFFIDTEDGSKSMMLWTVHIVNDEEVLTVTADDETGIILSVLHTNFWKNVSVSDDKVSSYKVPETGDGELTDIAKKWGEYLGIDLVDTSIYDKTIVSGLDEMEKEVDVLVKQGLDTEEAYARIYEEWGLVEEFQDRRLFATYEDENGMIVFMFRQNTEEIVFLAKVYE